MKSKKPKKSKDVSGKGDYPSGRPGGSENVWNFQESYPSDVYGINAGMFGKFTGKNPHKK